ncbi:MAG TPA: His-Xaa-Ser system radical SAM maturase HxsB [Polyangiaceae bacterium]
MISLDPPFHGRAHFAPEAAYRLAPLRFGRLDEARYVVTNDVGEHVVLSREDLVAFVRRQLPTTSPTYRALKARHLVFDTDSECALDLLALKYRTRAERIASFTGLHMFVVTLRCNSSCDYCQVSRRTEDSTAFDMTPEHADLAVDFAFRTPASHVKIELQGGEPLLRFDLVRQIIERGAEVGRRAGKNVAFVIATNLSLLTDDVLAFCKRYDVCLSTSLDGPADLHDRHRVARRGSSHAQTVEGLARARRALGPDFVGALMTTSRASLGRVEEIVDEYIRHGLRSIFLRSMSPYGFAARHGLTDQYDVDDWLAFYRRGLTYVIEVNRHGYPLREEYTAILLRKLWSPAGASFVDLQSPAGIGIAGIVYDHDGAVYASDEGRMLAAMGDRSFRLGHLGSDTYESIMTSDALLGPLEDTLLESAPMCSDCPFLPYCGADPVRHMATLGDPVGHKAFSALCHKQMGVLRHLITLVEDDHEARRVLLGWV